MTNVRGTRSLGVRRRGRQLALVALAGSAFGLWQGCILVSSSDDVQCEADTDCSSRGDGFADTVCGPEGVCVSKGLTGCTTNAECTIATEGRPSICPTPGAECVELLSEDCTRVIGDHTNDNAFIFSYMTPLTGEFGFLGEANAPLIELGIEEINDKQGIPGGPGGVKRPFVGLICDEEADVVRATQHVADVGIKAILGLDLPDYLVAVSEIATQNKILLISPNGNTPQIEKLQDQGLIWTMDPSTLDFGTVFAALTSQLEEQVRARYEIPAGEKIRVALTVFEQFSEAADDMNKGLQFNGERALDQSTGCPDSAECTFLRRDYGGDTGTEVLDFSGIINDLVEFQPHIILAFGSSEILGAGANIGLLQGIEENWPEEATHRPEWVMPSFVFGPETEFIITDAPNEAYKRLRGPVASYNYGGDSYSEFVIRYNAKAGDDPFQGNDEYYESMYLLAYATAAAGQVATLDGTAIATGIGKVVGGTQEFRVGPQELIDGLNSVSLGSSIKLLGASGALAEDYGPFRFDLATGSGVRDFGIWCASVDEEGTPFLDPSGYAGAFYQDLLTGECDGDAGCALRGAPWEGPESTPRLNCEADPE